MPLLCPIHGGSPITQILDPCVRVEYLKVTLGVVPKVSQEVIQERQGVPAREGPARGIPTPKSLTVRESHEPGPAPFPFSKRSGREAGRKVPARRGVVPAKKGGRGPGWSCSSAAKGSRSEPGTPHEPGRSGPLVFSQ